MVRPTNPKLMHKVMDAVAHLGENKGSSVRDILEVVKKGSNGPNRNLTMQVQRALKHAVTAGILKFSNSRYKPTIALPQLTHASRRRRTEDEYKVVEEVPDVDESTTGGADSFGAVQDRRKRRRSSRRRRGSRRRRSGRRRRGRRHANEEYDDMGPTDRRKMGLKSRTREDESVENKTQKNRNADKYSDVSESEHESRNRSRKPNPEHAHSSRRSTSRSRPREDVSEKNNRRSASRNRSQPRNNSQAPVNDDSDNLNAMDCDDDVHDNGADHDNCETKNCESDCSIH